MNNFVLLDLVLVVVLVVVVACGLIKLLSINIYISFVVNFYL